MDNDKKQALRAAKEIVVKFIEIGRISPNNFPEFFSKIYNEVLTTIKAGTGADPEPGSAAPRKKTCASGPSKTSSPAMRQDVAIYTPSRD